MNDSEYAIYPDVLKSSLHKLQENQDELITLFAALENYQRDIKEQDNAVDILRMTQLYVAGLDLFEDTAYYLVDSSTMDFQLALCHPTDCRDRLEKLVQAEINSGKFGWALRQNVSVFVDASAPGNNQSAVLHTLRSARQTAGMFCGLLKQERVTCHEISFSLLSILLGASADAITGVQRTTDLKGRIDAANRDLRKAIENAKQLAQQAQAANDAKSQFLASMSHEIRTPMNAIIGVTGLLLDTPLEPRQRQYGETVRSAGESLLSLINDILDYSKIEAGKMELELIDFEPRVLASEAIEILRVKAREKGLRLDCMLSTDVPERLQGDPGRLRQILLNLAGNAIKFTAKGSVTLMVSVDEADDQRSVVRFRIQDTGIGIPANRLDRLFQSFSQVDASTTRKYGGTGLGLAICKRLVDAMKGEIGVISHEGSGSEFWFTVPLTIAKPSAASSPNGNGHSSPAKSPAFNRGDYRLLLAEDNMTNQMVALTLLRQAGYTADAVANGLEAIEALRVVPYDLVLMDVQMPEMDGLEATRKIRDPATRLSNPQVPIVAMTAHAMKSDRDRCLEAGMNDYIAKPVRPRELLAVIDRLLGDRQAMPMPAPVVEVVAVTPSPCPPFTGPLVFNRQDMVSRLGDNPESIRNIANIFLKDAPALMEKLTKALAAQDPKAIAHQAHALRGAAAILGGERVKAIAERIESAANGKDLATAKSSFESMPPEFDLLIAEIKREAA